MNEQEIELFNRIKNKKLILFNFSKDYIINFYKTIKKNNFIDSFIENSFDLYIESMINPYIINKSLFINRRFENFTYFYKHLADFLIWLNINNFIKIKKNNILLLLKFSLNENKMDDYNLIKFYTFLFDYLDNSEYNIISLNEVLYYFFKITYFNDISNNNIYEFHLNDDNISKLIVIDKKEDNIKLILSNYIKNKDLTLIKYIDYEHSKNIL